MLINNIVIVALENIDSDGMTVQEELLRLAHRQSISKQSLWSY